MINKLKSAALIAAGVTLAVAPVLPSIASSNTIFVGTVRNNVGTLYRAVDGQTTFAGNARWDTCPQDTRLVGRDFQVNGFWVCASGDIADNTFYFGNVVNNRGYYWELKGGQAKPAGDSRWDTCWEGSVVAKEFSVNGFWLCNKAPVATAPTVAPVVPIVPVVPVVPVEPTVDPVVPVAPVTPPAPTGPSSTEAVGGILEVLGGILKLF